MLARLLDCPTSNPVHLEACLQRADLHKIAMKQFDILTQPSLLAIPFIPHVDGDFLPDKVEVGICISLAFFSLRIIFSLCQSLSSNE